MDKEPQAGQKPQTASYTDRLGLLPVGQQVDGAALHSSVFLNDLHLQICHLLLNGRIFPPHDVVKRAPFTLNVVNVEPGRGELEALFLQQTLPIPIELQEESAQLLWDCTRRRGGDK